MHMTNSTARSPASAFRIYATSRAAFRQLTEDDQILRLQNGVYLQLHAYMFRVAIPYGALS
jgi:sulfite reductase beta subunit-like hemoprotein